MDRYPEVPDWWYGIIFLINLGLAMFTCEYYRIDLPWWAVIFAVLIAAIFLVPIGIITAVANQTPGLNIITEFIIGYMLPGRPIANVTFKTYGYICMQQAVYFVQDLKLGHYMKIPPRHMFIAQTYGTFLAGLINLSTAYLMYALIPNICNLPGTWSCSSANVFYSASIIWGVVGPAKMFGPTSMYSSLLWFFIIGLVIPIPTWLLARRYPGTWLEYVHWPLILGATAIMPPAQPVMFPSWFILGFIFQFLIFRYRHTWWKKFTYIFSAGMDSGVAISGVVIFFAFQYENRQLNWWGTQPDCPLLNSGTDNS